MSKPIPIPGNRPGIVLAIGLTPVLLLAGCGDDDSSTDSPRTLTGTFIDSPVAGLDYEGDSGAGGRTDGQGRFQYQSGETVTFAIGDLTLGATEGAEVVTPLDVTEGAADSSDERVINRLVILQSLDADGDLNNGIQITEAITAAVSANADTINLEDPPEDFRASLEPVLSALEAGEAFSDLDPRARKVREVADATRHFQRNMSPGVVVATTYAQ